MRSASIRVAIAATFIGCACLALFMLADIDNSNGVVLAESFADGKVPEDTKTTIPAIQSAAATIKKKTVKQVIAQSTAAENAAATFAFPKLSKKYSKGVVQIEVVKAKHQWLSPEKPPETEEVSGSGFFVLNDHLGPKLKDSSDLHIVTNAHVAQDALKITVRLPKTGLLAIPCTVVGLSPPDEHDLALLRVDSVKQLHEDIKRKMGKDVEISEGVIQLPLGDSDDVSPGEKLMALGYPEGLPGVKSTLGEMSGYQEMSRKLYMQMTTPINPGNSGGPLICSRGRVIGVNTAGIEGSEAIGFAIPSAVLKAVLPVLATKRVFVRPVFGLVLNPLGSKESELFEMPKETHGQYIAKVYTGGIAHKSGIKKGDILTKIDGMNVSRRGQMMLKSINTYVSLNGYLGRTPLNQNLKVTVWRHTEKKEIELNLKYGETDPTAIPLIHEAALHDAVAKDFVIKGGLVFTPLTQNYVQSMITPVDVSGGAVVPAPDLYKYSQYPLDRKESRVVIADVVSSSLAEATKVFDSAMVVDEVNHKKVRTMAELCHALSTPVVTKEAKGGKEAKWLTVLDDQGTFGALPMDEIENNDKKLATMNLYSLAMTKCENRVPDFKAKSNHKAKPKQEAKHTKPEAKPPAVEMPAGMMPPGA